MNTTFSKAESASNYEFRRLHGSLDSFQMKRELMRRVVSAISQMKQLSPERPYFLDGLSLGAWGEDWACHQYGLIPIPLSEQMTERHDGYTNRGLKVEVKTSGHGKAINLTHCYEHLIVQRLTKDGCFREIYNGPCWLLWPKGRENSKSYRAGIRRVEEVGRTIPRCFRIPALQVPDQNATAPVIDLSRRRLKRAQDEAEEILERELGMGNDKDAFTRCKERHRIALGAFSRANPGPC